MCSRYTLTDLKALLALVEATGLGVDIDLDVLPARYNVAPTRRMPVILRDGETRGAAMRFGLTLPARNPAEKPLLVANARAETLLIRQGFRDATQRRRCLVPADGFYEWEKQGRVRLPHYFALKNRAAFFFAGLWEPATDTTPTSFAIVTTTPNTLLRPIHDRMPVMLGPNSGPAWLGDSPLEPARLAQLCRPLPAERMTGWRVDPRVNIARYEAADCVAPV
ncbi:MAG: SOS response-associated peptidase [Opitutae bacterium]|nr:SOS response-associated peptidase [Opitutae bacterium]